MDSCLLITVDCLRSDHVGCYGYERDTTPNIDELVEDGTIYEYSYSNAPGTAWALQTLLMGVYTHQINGFGLTNTDGLLLSEHFNIEGYATGGFANNGWLSRDYDYNKYFDQFNGVHEYQSKQSSIIQIGRRIDSFVNNQKIRQKILRPAYERIQDIRNYQTKQFREGVTDEDVVSDAIEWIGTQRRTNTPFFAWVHLMDAHSPWSRWNDHLQAVRGDTDIEHVIDANNKIEPGESAPTNVIDTYDAAIRSADEQVGRLLDAVKDDTTVVVTGDHGEELGEYGSYHRTSLYSSMTRVPLIFRSPEISSMRVNEYPVQHLDITPTLADLLGHSPHSDWCGESLVDINREIDEDIWFSVGTKNPRRGVRRGDYKYIESDKGNDVALFADGLNHHDSIDVRKNHPKIFKKIKRDTKEFKEWMEKNQIKLEEKLSSSTDDLSDEVESNLKELGYLDK